MEILDSELVKIIMGLCSVIGAILFVAGIILNKVFGLIHFGKQKVCDPEKCTEHIEVIKNYNDILSSVSDMMNNFNNLSEKHSTLNGLQKDLSEKVSKMHDQQIKNKMKHDSHEKRFDQGDIQMSSMSRNIKQLCIGVGILLNQAKPATTPESVKLDVNSLIEMLTTFKED